MDTRDPDASDIDEEDGDAMTETGWRASLRRWMDEATDYTREHPLEGLVGAFIAGLLVSIFLRRGR